MKRFFDFTAAAAAILLLLPVFVIVAIMIRAKSDGPALFVQKRVGRNEKDFWCYKFRTMVSGSPHVGSHESSASWITPLGAKLRRYKIDELPQLFNVLKGEMSLVGPRPCLPSQADVINARRGAGVFSMRPGITGIAQLAGVDMSTPEKLAQLDSAYLARQGLLFDLRLIFVTALGGGSGDAAAKPPAGAA